MNCKEGDLAIVVKSYAGNEGKIVRCVRYIGVVDGWRGDDYWVVDSILTTNTGLHGPYAPDSFLRPIRDQDGPDETLTWKDVPKEVKACQ